MIIRSARESDIPGILKVRNSEQTKGLIHPSSMTEESLLSLINESGKVWICEGKEELAGFGIVDMVNDTIWALYVNSEAEDYRCDNALHDILLKWFFASKQGPIRLGTVKGKDAEEFFLRNGWEKQTKESSYEITRESYKNLQAQETAE